MYTITSLPYHTDATTEKIALTNHSKIDASSTPVPTMWINVGVAVLVGTAFVAGKSYDSISKNTIDTSGELFGATMMDFLTINCDAVLTGGKNQCQCVNIHCTEEYGEFVNNPNLGGILGHCVISDRSKDCTDTCIKESEPNILRKCMKKNGCFNPI